MNLKERPWCAQLQPYAELCAVGCAAVNSLNNALQLLSVEQGTVLHKIAVEFGENRRGAGIKDLRWLSSHLLLTG